MVAQASACGVGHETSKKTFRLFPQQLRPNGRSLFVIRLPSCVRKTMASTPEGKAKSSLNALKHGCCSKKFLVKDEFQEDFDRLRQGWLAAYEPDDDAAASLLEQVILNDWQLRRVQGQYQAMQEKLDEIDPWEWTPEQEHKLNLMLRYKTASERSFYRSVAAIERFRKVRVQEHVSSKRKPDEAPQDDWIEKALKALGAPLPGGADDLDVRHRAFKPNAP